MRHGRATNSFHSGYQHAAAAMVVGGHGPNKDVDDEVARGTAGLAHAALAGSLDWRNTHVFLARLATFLDVRSRVIPCRTFLLVLLHLDLYLTYLLPYLIDLIYMFTIYSKVYEFRGQG